MFITAPFIHNYPKLEKIQMSFNRQMHKQAVVHPDNEILLSNKKEYTINTCHNTALC